MCAYRETTIVTAHYPTKVVSSVFYLKEGGNESADSVRVTAAEARVKLKERSKDLGEDYCYS